MRLLDANDKEMRAERLEILSGIGPLRLTKARLRTVTRLSPCQFPQLTPGQPHGPDALFSTQLAMRYALLFFHESRIDLSSLNPMEGLVANAVACNSDKSEIIHQSPHSFECGFRLGASRIQAAHLGIGSNRNLFDSHHSVEVNHPPLLLPSAVGSRRGGYTETKSSAWTCL